MVDARFINAGATAVNTQAPAADIATFWRGFNDARLSALIERALQANGDLRIAQARLQEARANQGEADAAGLPGVGIDTSVERSVRPITQQPGTTRSARTGTAFDASFVANWEIDLFGGVRRGREAAAARVSAGEAGLSAAHTAVAAAMFPLLMAIHSLYSESDQPTRFGKGVLGKHMTTGTITTMITDMITGMARRRKVS